MGTAIIVALIEGGAMVTVSIIRKLKEEDED